MAFLKLVLSLLIVCVVVTVGLIFSFRNDAPVSIDFLLFQFSSMGLGFWVLLSFIVGIILGWLISLPKGLVLKFSNQHQQKKLDRQSHELSRLKGASVKGN